MSRVQKPLRSMLALGAALIAVGSGPAFAQSASTDLERRVQELERALAAVKAELASTKASTVELLAKPAPAPAAPAPGPAPQPDGFKVGAATIKIGGFVKAEALVSSYSDGDTATNPLGRDFYLPSSIPVGAAAAQEDADFDAHAKQTRLSLIVTTAVDGHKLAGYVEGDFQSATGTQASERTTNATNFGLRRAYVTFDDFLFGQDWSTFMNVIALPETTDFIGPTEGTVFIRQPVARYTRKINDTWSFVVAAENPETGYVTATSATMLEADDDSVPDIVGRLNFKKSSHELALTAVARQLSVDTGAASADAFGWGLAAAGKFMLNKTDDVRFSIGAGEGASRYFGLNLTPDAVFVGGDLEPAKTIAGFVALRHYWGPRTRSTFMVSGQKADDPGVMPSAATQSASSIAANLFHSPVKSLDLGLEIRHGTRETFAGQDGALDRIHLIAKQGF